MKSFESSTETPNSDSFENGIILPEIKEDEARIENQEGEVVKFEDVEESIAGKADSIILATRKDLEIKEKGISFEKLVARGAVGFAVIATLMSSPQFNSEAMAAEDDIATKLNKEFSDFADNNLAERISAVHQGGFVNPDYSGENPKEKFKKDVVVQFLKVTNNLSTEDAENAYRLNKIAIDGKIKNVFGDGETVSSINLLSEGGVMVSFNGNLENLDDIPAAFMDNLKEIKDNPVKFISEQVLNVLVVDDAKKSVGNFIEEHTAEGESHLSY